MKQSVLELKNLKFMPQGNRELVSNQIAKLKHSINKYGILRDVIVIKTSLFGSKESYYIIDGQHLYMACESLGMLDQLQYKLCKHTFETVGEIVDFVATLNTSQTPWKQSDYINAYASTNLYLDYNKLIQKRLKYNLSYTLLGMVYGGYSNSMASNMIKSGKFVFVDETKGDEVVKILQDLILVFGRSNSMTLNRFTLAFYHWYNAVNYDHDKFIAYVKDNIDQFIILNTDGIETLLSRFK